MSFRHTPPPRLTLSVIAAGLALRTALLVGLLLASGAALRAQTVRWVAPTNWTGGSFSNGLTAGGPASFSLPTMRSWLQANNLPDLIVYFYPGDYQVFDSANLEHRLRITGDSNRVVRLIGLVGTNGALPRLIMTPEPTNSAGMQNSARSWPPGFNQETLIATSNDGTTNNGAVFHDGISYRFYLGRVDLENLELDGNFEGQGAFTSAANPTGYKRMAINLTARTGRIRNVKVRHFGAVGQVPWSLVDGNSAGIESFPVWVITQDETNKPAYNDAPWVIEDVEVSDFHSLHDGYGTLIGGHGLMNNQPGQPFSADPLILIRRCMVNGGNTIAFGTAGTSSVRSGRIRVEDCVTLNSTVAFNTDTFSCGPWTMTNSVFLDFLNFGFLGQPNSGPNHLSYSVTDNLLRIRGRSQTPAYQEYYISQRPPAKPEAWKSVNRSKRVIFPLVAQSDFSSICSTRWSSFSCSWMYRRTATSSLPTVETQYPRAQKFCPT